MLKRLPPESGISESTSSTSAPRSGQADRQVAADEAEPAGDHHAAAAVEGGAVDVSAAPGRSAPRRASPAGAPQVLAPDHQRPPQLQHVDAGAGDAPEVEELRGAVRAVVVVHRHLGDAEAGVLELLHHLEADRRRCSSRAAPCRRSAPHQAEVAVDVAHLQPEQALHGVVVDAADDDAVQRVGAADLPAVHQVDVVGERASTAP